MIGAARAGIRTVILPARNRKDFDEIPQSTRTKLQFVRAEGVEDALAAALSDSSEEKSHTRTEVVRAAEEEEIGLRAH